MQRVAGKQLFSDVSVWGSFGPMRRTRPVRASPPMVMSDQQARLSGRKRDAGPRAVCCWRFIGSSERTEPIAPDQSARRNGNSPTLTPGDRRDGYCRLSSSSKLAS